MDKKNFGPIIKKGTIVLASRNDGFKYQGVYFGKCDNKHIVDCNGVSALVFDNAIPLPSLSKKEAKQRISELFAKPSDLSSQKVRDVIDRIKC